MSWRCLHCDESFDDADSAAAHFGTREWHNPACKIDAAEYRRMEAREASYAEEDAEIHRMMRRMESLHQQSLRRAEEAGYAKGLQAYTELQAKLDAVTRDAERYRFLRDKSGNDLLEHLKALFCTAEFDSAVDHAIADQGRAGEGRSDG